VNGLRDLLVDVLARHDVPGAAVAVSQDGRLTEAAAGVLNRRTGVESTVDSVFQVGSITKVFTAILVHQLVDEGRIDLDAPVQGYAPHVGVAEPVTARQLLCHSAGFEGDVDEDTGRGDDALDRYVALLRDAPQIHPPGAMFSYSNAGYNVLGALAAHLRGGTWESVMAERLLTPLGITHAALFAEEALLFRVSAGHVGGEVSPHWQLPRSGGPDGSTFCAAPRELVTLGRALVAAAPGVLSRESAEAMRTKAIDVPGDPASVAGWGLGCMLVDWSGTPAFGHDGDTVGQAATWRVVPDHDLVIAACVNGGSAGAALTELVTTIAHEMAGLRVPPRSAPPDPPLTMPLDGFAGRYSSPRTDYVVTADGAGLGVRMEPSALARSWGAEEVTIRYVPLRTPDRFGADEPVGGLHRVLTFIDGGRYLHSGRAIRRAGP